MLNLKPAPLVELLPCWEELGGGRALGGGRFRGGGRDSGGGAGLGGGGDLLGGGGLGEGVGGGGDLRGGGDFGGGGLGEGMGGGGDLRGGGNFSGGGELGGGEGDVYGDARRGGEYTTVGLLSVLFSLTELAERNLSGFVIGDGDGEGEAGLLAGGGRALGDGLPLEDVGIKKARRMGDGDAEGGGRGEGVGERGKGGDKPTDAVDSERVGGEDARGATGALHACTNSSRWAQNSFLCRAVPRADCSNSSTG